MPFIYIIQLYVAAERAIFSRRSAEVVPRSAFLASEQADHEANDPAGANCRKSRGAHVGLLHTLSCTAIPISMAMTNRAIWGIPTERDATAGPGQKPPSPQPRPNIADPTIRGASIRRLVGTSKLSLRSGRRIRFITCTPRKATMTAPPRTNARLASQAPKMSRKPWTRTGFSIPDKDSPKPKTMPEPSAAAN